MKTFENKICIVTGSSSGIGAAFAQALSERGAKVVLFARRAEKLDEIARVLPGESLMVVGDVTEAADRTRLIAQTLEKWGRIDVLINNAGKDDRARFLKISASDVDAILQTNLVAVVHLVHEVAPLMVNQKHGLIINVSSAQGYLNLPRAAIYSTSKAGLSAFSLVMHRELSPYDIQVMNFIPGYTRSEMIPESVDAKLPRFVKVAPALDAVNAALDAALRGKIHYSNADFSIRVFTWINRTLPRLSDWIARKMW